MKIQNYVNHLNTKPTHVRERHMYLWTLVGTFLVMVIWVAHMGREFSPSGTSGTVAIAVENKEEKVSSPFSVIGTNLKSAFQNSRATAIGAFDSNGMSIESGKNLKVIDLQVIQ